MSILTTEHLGKIYEGKVPYTALSDINFSIEKGEFVAIMGPSGSGKSTLLNVVSTIDHPTSGNVSIDGQDPHKMNDDELAHFRRSTLGFVFQDFNLIHTLTVGENIMLPLTLEGIPVPEIKKRTEEVAKMLGIQQLLSKRTFEISGGQAQRTAVARAVVTNPSLLLADEPTGNLDSKATKDVMELFQMLNETQNATILMVTHDSFVASYCKRVLMPYAMSYNAWTENADVSGDLAVIEKELQNLPGYQEAAFDLWYSESEESRKAIISASEYNKMMEFLDREPVAVSKDGVFLVTGNAGETITTVPSAMQTFFEENGLTLSVEGNTDSIITLSGFTSSICVLNDAVFEALQPQMKNITITAFLYDNWETNSDSPETIKNKLNSTIESRDANVIDAYSYYHSTQLQNNLTLYIGSMLCFTFILAVASFIYSRLYSELEAECKKYRGIVKIGLSKKELSAALSKVTSLILWIPFLVAVAYLWIGIAISEQYVIVSNVPVAFRCTIVLFAVQTVVYFIINVSYKKAVFRKVYQRDERI